MGIECVRQPKDLSSCCKLSGCRVSIWYVGSVDFRVLPSGESSFKKEPLTATSCCGEDGHPHPN